MQDHYFLDGDVAVITLDQAPVNALSSALCESLIAGLRSAQHDHRVRAVVLVGQGRVFSAGADLKGMGRGPTLSGVSLRDVIAQIQGGRMPVLAAIHGQALGGGLELALACHYRIAQQGAQLGLPEVKLGLLPGGGGTQRLPRKVGMAKALELIVHGTVVLAEQALQMGLIDDVFTGAPRVAGLAHVRQLLQRGTEHPNVDAMVVERDDAALAAARVEAGRRYRGQLAPLACIDCIERASSPDIDQALQYERERFHELRTGTQHAALKHLFFATRAAAKVRGLPLDIQAVTVARVGVVGAGTMGRGIAMSLANAGLQVTLVESAEEALQRGLQEIHRVVDKAVEGGKLAEDLGRARKARIQGALSLEALHDCDLVIEAVYENLDVKLQVFRALDSVCKDGAVLATNTSGLDVNAIAAATRRPADVVGLHFFSPAHVMKLLEIVRAEHTSASTLATALALARTTGKVPVVVGVCDGFVGNRMVRPYSREADFMLEEGASVEQIDRVMEDFGMAMGRFRMADLAGLDISWAVRKAQAATRPPQLRYSTVGDRLCALGRLGQKSGAGYYRYAAGSHQALPDPLVADVVEQAAHEAGIARREINDEEVRERMLYALVNEGARLLGEGIAQRASDIDVIYTNGYGFAPHLGGPMFYADSVGLPQVLHSIRALHARFGEIWRPASLLERLVAEGRNFHSPESQA
jgi:3-hydroxyacyl-CoA dehydrogenase